MASGLKSPRSILFDKNGNLLVVQQGNGVVVLTFNENGCLGQTTQLINANEVCS